VSPLSIVDGVADLGVTRESQNFKVEESSCSAGRSEAFINEIPSCVDLMIFLLFVISHGKFGKVQTTFLKKESVLTDFCPLGCYRPIKNINFNAKFSQKFLFL